MEDAALRLARAERIVYLFPEGFDARRFIDGQLDGKRIFDYRRTVPPGPGAGAAPVPAPFTFYGVLRGRDFAIEVRPRSATIAAESFDVRRDVLLALKEFVDLTSGRDGI
jgi:hypothetical protein